MARGNRHEPGRIEADWSLGRARGETARALEVLTRAGGGVVSFEELAEAGIERPGHCVYELEASGYEVERVYATSAKRRGRQAGVRLTAGPPAEAEASPAPQPETTPAPLARAATWVRARWPVRDAGW